MNSGAEVWVEKRQIDFITFIVFDSELFIIFYMIKNIVLARTAVRMFSKQRIPRPRDPTVAESFETKISSE